MTRAATRMAISPCDAPIADGEASLAALCEDRVTFAAGVALATEGEARPPLYLVETGWVLRVRVLASGARQIVGVALPGDLVPSATPFPEASAFDHVARTPVSAWRLSRPRLSAALDRTPALAAALLRRQRRDERILAERVVSLGRRSARVRAAHLLCEFAARLGVGGDGAASVAMPVSQEDVADMLGLSLVHLNKVLRGFERDGLLRFRKGVLSFGDRRRLEREAGFDAGYLDPDPPPARA